jgi:hypothetical protein
MMRAAGRLGLEEAGLYPYVSISGGEDPATANRDETMTDKPLRIDTPDFKATEWEAGFHADRPIRVCQCWEFEGGKWEGFVAFEFVA